MKRYFFMSLFFLPLLFFSLLLSQDSASHSSGSPSSERERMINPWDDPLFSDPSQEHITSEKEGESFEGKFTRMLMILGLLIGFMILAAWALKKLMKTRGEQLNTTSAIKVLETRALSPRSTLYLIDIKGQTLLIAESPTMVSSIAAFKSSEEEM